MNERIRELAEKAGFFPELNWDHTGWHSAGHNNTFEKLALLIVRECAKTAGDFEYARLHDSLVEDHILKHFGVEK